MTDRISARAFRHLLTRAHADCLIATDGAVPAGYAALLYRANAEVARLHSLAVDPGARGGGVGRTLLTATEQAAQDRGATVLRLAVREDNPIAIKLYRLNGYRELRTESLYYSDRMSALHMEKALVAAGRQA